MERWLWQFQNFIMLKMLYICYFSGRLCKYLFKDARSAREAAEALKITAQDMAKFGIADEIVGPLVALIEIQLVIDRVKTLFVDFG